MIESPTDRLGLVRADPAIDLVPDEFRDHAEKRRRVLEILEHRGVDHVVLRSAPAVNWYLGGAATHVSLAGDPIVAVEVTRDADWILVTDNEAERLLAEELPPWAEILSRRWWEPVRSAPIAEAAIADELRAARNSLLPSDQRRFAALGRTAATILTNALSRATPTMSELDLAAEISAAAIRAGLVPLVLLVGGSDRLEYRHPLPTAAPIGRRAMVVLCARQGGLITNLTRWLRFGPPTDKELDGDERIRLVEADAFAACRPGARLGDVLRAIADAYPRHGFDEDEWTRHHQGGVAGYDGRDPRALPDLAVQLSAPVHVAWNPSAARVKIEDTVVIDGDVVTPLTVDPRWPTVEVHGVPRPIPLEL